MHFESSNLPGSGPIFPDLTFENWPKPPWPPAANCKHPCLSYATKIYTPPPINVYSV